MPFTYDPDRLQDPNDGPLMQVRLLIGDTDSSDPQLQDAEIQYYLASEANTLMAASRSARAIAGRYSRKVDKAVGDLKITASQRYKQYDSLATELQNRGRLTQIPTAGGVLISDRDSNQADTSVEHTFIRRGMHDFTAPPVVPNAQQ